MATIRLTGKLLAWDHFDCEEVGTPPNDGDVQIQPRSDMRGRLFASGGHTDAGYSGYFRGYIYLGGKRKTLVDWWRLFPGKEHHYAAQQDKPKTTAVIANLIASRVGTEVVRVKGGYAFRSNASDT